MNVKSKPCKGTGQANGYGCGAPTLHRIHGLGKMCCYAKWLFESDAGKIKLYKSSLKSNTRKVQSRQSALKEALSATKKMVHEYVRLRDKGRPCISCNKPWQIGFHAGHYFKAELFETLRFNLNNINGQCPECNILNEGNFEIYSLMLPKRIGYDAFHNLQQLSKNDKRQSKVWNVENLQIIQDEVKSLMRYLNKIN